MRGECLSALRELGREPLTFEILDAATEF